MSISLPPAFICHSMYLHGNRCSLISDIPTPVYVNQRLGLLDNPMVKRGLAYAPHLLADELLASCNLNSNTPPERRAFILASGNSKFGGATWQRAIQGSYLDINYRLPPLLLNQIYAGKIAGQIGYDGLISTDASACASSLKALHEARILLAMGDFDEVAILAIEDQICYGVLDFFTTTNACLTQQDYMAGILPSAFDSHNRSFILGHGAAFAILANDAGVKANKGFSRSVLTATALASEHKNTSISPHPDGRGYECVIAKALDSAGVTSNHVDLIKTHGTGTIANNTAEKKAIESVFGNDFIATSYKPLIGHTLGVSGLLEMLMCIDEAIGGTISPIANKTSGDDRFISEPLDRQVKSILCLSSGMGNIYASALCEIL